MVSAVRSHGDLEGTLTLTGEAWCQPAEKGAE